MEFKAEPACLFGSLGKGSTFGRYQKAAFRKPYQLSVIYTEVWRELPYIDTLCVSLKNGHR